MLLTIDSGNTNTVFAVGESGSFRSVWRSATAANRTAEEYFVWLESLLRLEGIEREEIRGAVLASVVPGTTDNLRHLCREFFGAEPLVVGSKSCQTGVDLRVDNPAAVGADRIANAVGAGVRYGGNLVVVDFGTATTFDVVDKEGAYCGGVIAPGIRLSLDALHQAAASLPRVPVERPAGIVGRDTVPAMQSGIYWGYVSLVDGVCRRIAAERGEDMEVIATGGLATLFEEGSEMIHRVDSMLTLHGLVEIYRRNQESEE